jgi:hypothetical protein
MNLVWLKKREALPKVSVLLKVLASTLRHDGHQLVSNNS